MHSIITIIKYAYAYYHLIFNILFNSFCLGKELI